MEKNNSNGKAGLSAVLLVIALIVIAVMAFFMYQLNNEKNIETKKSQELQAQVDKLNGTVNDLQGKISKVSEAISSNETSDEKIKEVFSKYINVAGRYLGSVESLLEYFKLDYSKEKLDNNTITKTTIKYEDFENKMLEIMTKNLYEKYFFNSTKEESLNKRIYNLDGFLGYSDYTQSGATYSVESISFDSEKNIYTANIYDDSHGEKAYKKTEFKIDNLDGKYVVSECKLFFEDI